MTAPTLPGIKRGEVFRFTAAYADNGTPMVFSPSELKAQVRTSSGTLVAELSVSGTATPGTYQFQDLNTSDWPTGNLHLDITRTASGETTATPTIIVPVERPVTL